MFSSQCGSQHINKRGKKIWNLASVPPTSGQLPPLPRSPQCSSIHWFFPLRKSRHRDIQPLRPAGLGGRRDPCRVLIIKCCGEGNKISSLQGHSSDDSRALIRLSSPAPCQAQLMEENALSAQGKRAQREGKIALVSALNFPWRGEQSLRALPLLPSGGSSRAQRWPSWPRLLWVHSVNAHGILPWVPRTLDSPTAQKPGLRDFPAMPHGRGGLAAFMKKFGTIHPVIQGNNTSYNDKRRWGGSSFSRPTERH